MGLGDRFKRAPRPDHASSVPPQQVGQRESAVQNPQPPIQYQGRHRSHQHLADATRFPSPPAPPVPSPAGKVWVPSGTSITAHGLTLPGGMFYVGPWLRAVGFDGPDPTLIDLRLPVAGPPDWSGSGMPPRPSYAAMSPTSRAAYLEWLADGRRDPRAFIGYVFLFFYGLERRVLLDCAAPGPARSDLASIRAELDRLLRLYGGHPSFRSSAEGLLEVVGLYSGHRPTHPPVRTAARWPAPLALRQGLGLFAAAGRPIPANWALTWLWFRPEIYARIPAPHCVAEHEHLFALRYSERFGDGIRVEPGGAPLLLEYSPANAGLPYLRLDLGLPDVFQLPGPSRSVAMVAEECADALAAYSRWLGRHPDGRGTLPAEAFLPRELVDMHTGPAAPLFAWASARLGAEETATVRAEELMALWPTDPGSGDRDLTKSATIQLAKLLGNGGFGVEPDPRLGGRLQTDGPVVLFRSAGEPTAAASTAYAASSALLHLAVVVSQVDGDVADAEQRRLLEHLETGLDLTNAERVRLRAHLQLLLLSGARLGDVSGRLTKLSVDQRTRIGKFLLTVAAADGTISADEVTILTRIYDLLGLDPADVASALEAATDFPAMQPVTVRTAAPAMDQHRLPRRDRASVQLDQAVIEKKIAETVEVSSLLATIFVDDPEPSVQPVAVVADRTVEAVSGLDLPHSGLLRALADKSRWTRTEFEEITETWGVLPDGAIDVLNDAAYEMAGDPIFDGEDPIKIDVEVLGEMLR